MHHKHIVLERAQLGVDGVAPRELGLDDVGGPLSAYLLRPYLDLSEFVDGPSETSSVEVAFRQLATPDAPRLMIQTHPGRGLRTALVRESGLPAYGITRARELPERLRTDRWRQLVEWTRARLPPMGHRLRLATLLNTLGLFGETVELFTGRVGDVDGGDGAATALSMQLAIARLRIDPSAGTERVNAETLRQAAENDRGDRYVRLGAALTLVVLAAKRRAVDEVRHWREVAEGQYRLLDPEAGLPDVLYASTFWRAVSYLPHLLGDRVRTTEELDLAEHHALAFRPRDSTERMVWAANMNPLLETRMRAALDTGDRDLAWTRLSRLAELEPLSAKVRIHVGKFHLDTGAPEKALPELRQAITLGAPFTGLSWYLTARCLDRLGDHTGALRAYAEAVRADPASVDARLRIHELAGAADGGLAALPAWAGDSLGEITTRLKAPARTTAKEQAR
jgi:tetratricopeptide (TPR) repeat protein